ncbi:MAG: hypothetical protein QM778_35640 [Myxococcales bacterium]
MKNGDQAHVTAHGITLEGVGVAELEGRSVMCAGLFPGESAQVRIEAVSRQHPRAFARLQQLEMVHPDRREAPCPNHVGRGGRCAGCALMELSEEAQRRAKRDMLAAQFGLEVAELESAGPVLGYRWSSKRVALGRAGSLLLGSYVRESHVPARMTGCLVEHPLLRDTFDRLEARAQTLQVEPFDERSGRGDLRYVWGKTNGRQVLITLVTAAAESRAAELLSASLDDVLVGVSQSVQAGPSNNMRGSSPRALTGRADLPAELLGHSVPLAALGFLQPNPEVATLAYAALTDHKAGAQPGRLALDLYAGAGVTTAKLRTHFEDVVPCESYPESAEKLGVPAQDVAEFVEQAVERGTRPDLVVANPPRKGMGERVCAGLVALAAPELRIMSCGPEGLARDLSRLAACYQLVSLRAFDTLPQTPHVELVAKLTLRGEVA